MAADPRQMVRDPEFRALPRGEQRAVLAQLDRDFRELEPDDQDEVLDRALSFGDVQAGRSSTAPAAPRGEQGTVRRAIASGVQGSFAAAERMVSNAAGLAARAAESRYPEGYVARGGRAVEQYFGERAAELEGLAAENADEGFGPAIGRAVAAMPVGLASVAPAVIAAGPVAGFAAAGGLGAAHLGAWDAAKEAAWGAALGALFPATRSLRA